MRLQKLESIDPQAANFTPPPGAVSVDENRITIDNRVLMLDYQLHQEQPQYPPSMHPPGGAATVKFIITKDGHVSEVQFLDGTPEMKKPLEHALKKNVYRPFIVRGEPVEVEVQQKYIYEIHARH
jgi:outer membrane biosynthesis protein TonB